MNGGRASLSTARVRATAITLFAVGVVAIAASSASAGQARAAAPWFWTPGWCKSMLHNYGVQFDDGRTFYVEQANCIGKGGPRTCWWSSGYATRRYSAFTVFTRSYDGTIRIFTLVPTGRTTFRGSDVRALGNAPNAYDYYAKINELATALAQQEHEKGCGSP